MDWTGILVQLAAAAIGGLIGVTPLALIFAYWCGGLNQRVNGMAAHCQSECERQTREHSRLFQIAEEHGKRLGEVEGSVRSIDRRLVIIEAE